MILRIPFESPFTVDMWSSSSSVLMNFHITPGALTPRDEDDDNNDNDNDDDDDIETAPLSNISNT